MSNHPFQAASPSGPHLSSVHQEQYHARRALDAQHRLAELLQEKRVHEARNRERVAELDAMLAGLQGVKEKIAAGSVGDGSDARN